MLVLTRREDQSILIDGGITVTVTKIRGNRVWIGIDAPKETVILREEVPREKEARDEQDTDAVG